MYSSLALEPMDGADAETNLASHLHNAEPFASSRRACSILSGSAPGRRSFLRTLPALETKFELGEGARDLEQQLAGRRGGVDVLLIQVEIDADLLEVLNRAEQVDQRSAEPINDPAITTSNLRRLASLSMHRARGDYHSPWRR